MANILEGSVQREPNEVRVNVQLIKAATDAHLWADIYDRKLTDVFAVESDIAKTIAETLQAKLTGSEKVALAKTPTTSQEAYELYLKGRFFWNKRTAPDLRKSIDYFNKAIAKDPNYALAYAARAQAWLVLPAYGGGASIDFIKPTDAAIQKAFALDQTSSDAYTARGMYRSIFQLDLPGGGADYERALELNPNDATSHHWLATDVLAALGESEEEVAEMRRARDLDPLSLIINSNLGIALLHNGHLDAAVAQVRKSIDMDGTFYDAHDSLGMTLEDKGQFPEALAEYQKASSLTDDSLPLGLQGHLLGVMGRRDEASKILSQLETRSQHEYIDPYILAIADLGLGQRELALAALEKGYADRNVNNLEYIRMDPFLKHLHGDPRFEALAEKIVPAKEFKGAPTEPD